VFVSVQIGTTKGTGGDVLILEEAAYCDEGFFYETVAPILSVGNASLVAISTLTSEINFYTRLIKMVDPATDRPLFTTRCIELCCEKCKEDGKAHECVHMLHLVPSWQSQERHRKLKIMMQVRDAYTCCVCLCFLLFRSVLAYWEVVRRGLVCRQRSISVGCSIDVSRGVAWGSTSRQ
jgi:hypothetical protein